MRWRGALPAVGMAIALATACGPGLTSPRPSITSTTSSSVGSATFATGAPAPPWGGCFAGTPTGDVGYELATDTITVCGDAKYTLGDCVALAPGAPPRLVDPPPKPLPAWHAVELTKVRPPLSLVRVGARLVLAEAPKRWIAIAASPGHTEYVEVLWSSVSGARALVERVEWASGATMPFGLNLELVDLDTHVVLSRTDACANFDGAEVATDPAETLLYVRFYVASPRLTWAVVDLSQGRILAIDPSAVASPKDCVLGKSLARDEIFGELFDFEHRRTSNALLTLEGKPFAALHGDFPVRKMRELIVDAATHVVVGTDSGVCAGVMRIVPGSTPAAPQPPRCLPTCGAAEKPTRPIAPW